MSCLSGAWMPTTSASSDESDTTFAVNISLIVALAEVVAAFAASLAILFAVREFRHRTRDDLDGRVAELLGVSLTYTLRKPRESEDKDGFGVFPTSSRSTIRAGCRSAKCQSGLSIPDQ